MRKALVVLSGGQDSTTCLYEAKQRFDELHAITFDYNQRHRLEIDAAQTVAQLAGVASHEIIELGPILKGRSFLTNLTGPIETFENFTQMSRKNAAKTDKLDSSFVPMRNPLFLTLAANRAAVLDCTAIVTGVTAADFVEYGEFSWEWLGGFVDAEGHFSQPNKTGWRLNISQSDPEFLNRLLRWLNVPGSISIRHGSEEAELYIGVQAASSFMDKLSPHLHSSHRRAQASRLGIELSTEAPLSEAYVAGFWEGDGSCWSTMQLTRQARKTGSGKVTATFKFFFFQKDPGVLEKISEYLGCGRLYQRNTQNKIWVLDVSDGPYGAKLLNRLRPHFNVLGSFQKVTKYRHRIGMEGGGFNPPYPDCTPDYIWRQQMVFDEALRSPSASRIEIQTPVMYLTKAQSIRLAQSLPGCMEALAFTHTAYDGHYPPTGKDHASTLRAQGFLEAGVPDPLVVRAWREGLMKLPATRNYEGLLGNP